MKHLIILTCILLGFSGCTTKSTTKSTTTQDNATVSVADARDEGESTMESNVPFYDMTIPYLRSRSYPSSMGDLRPLSTKSGYSSFTTNYTSDGLRINALITKPTGNMPEGGWPAIVFVHGYIPPSLYVTTTRYLDHVDYLARNGYVVFKIDLRGHGNSEGTPEGAYYSSDYIIDTLSARTALQNLDFVNKDRVGLWGHSMAGNVVIRSLASQPDIPAVAIWAGAGFTYTDLLTYRINDTSYRPPQPSASTTPSRRQLLFAQHGQFTPDSPYWKTVAPTNYLNDVNGAVSLFHAVDDTVVSVEYSRNLKKILDSTPIEHSFFEYSSGGHNITGSSFSQAMRSTVEFYNKHL